jgi:4'-phosphopantetheinyl transferase
MSRGAAAGIEARARALASAAPALTAWQIPLEQPDDVVAALATVLAPEEHARAARYVFPRDRRRFVVTRACLRVLLARHAGGRAAEVAFTYGAHGKPAFLGGDLAFNVSHAGERALVALTRGVALGVDLEALRPLTDLRDIAARYFSAAESRTIASMPADQRELAFFLCWTRKEAFVKARGDGLSLALDRYSVTCTPGEPARVVDVDGSASEAARWSVLDLRPAAGYVGAVVMRAPAPSLSLAALDVERDVVPYLDEGFPHPLDAGEIA